ncbi:MAG: hypothetical protein LBF41_02810 [Deltaproteobacteria bacterium]|nr:hypothetical protein [Deltaproteobacteria bacterium]
MAKKKRFPAILAAPAKINLFLKVRGKSPDGEKHELFSLMARLSLADTVVLDYKPAVFFPVLTDGPDLLTPRLPAGELPDPGFFGENNLCVKALAAYRKKTRFPRFPLEITLKKRVPAKSGLGGGSSDGAAVLKLLNRLSPEPLSAEALADMAFGLGADMPFFLGGDDVKVPREDDPEGDDPEGDDPEDDDPEARGDDPKEPREPSEPGPGERGRPFVRVLADAGKKFFPFSGELPGPFVLLAKPPGGLSTKAVFEAYRELAGPVPKKPRPFRPDRASGFSGKNFPAIGENDLAPAILKLSPETGELHRALGEVAAGAPRGVTGSGTACFALFATARESGEARARLLKAAGADRWWTEEACFV